MRRAIGGFGQTRRRGSALARLGGRLAAFVLALAVLGLGGLGLRMAQGPVALDDLVPRIEALASEALGPDGHGRRVRIGHLSIGFGDGDSPAPDFYLRDVALTEADGTVLAAAPSVRIGFRPLDLLAGRLRLDALTVTGASLTLALGAEGRVVGDIAPVAPAGTQAPGALQALLAGLLADPPPLVEALERVEFRGLDVVATVAGPDFAVREGWVRFVRRDGGLLVDASLPLPLGPGPVQPLQISARLAPDGSAEATLRLAALRVADLAALHPALEPLAAADLSGVLRLRVGLAADGSVDAAAGELELGSGRLHFGERALALYGARLAATREGEGVRIDALGVQGPALSLSAQGTLMPVPGPGGRPAGAVVTLALGPLALPLDDPLAGPVPTGRFDRGFVAARLTGLAAEGEPLRLDIADLHLSRGPLRIDMTGTVAAEPAGPVVRLDGRLADLPVEDLIALWPPAVAPGAIRWMREHMRGGLVDEAVFGVRGPLAAPVARLDFAFSDAAAEPLPPMPAITGGRGWGSVGNDGFALTLAEGEVAVPGPAGGTIRLDGSSFRLDDFEDDLAPARISVLGQGSAASMMTLIGMPPLSLMDRIDLDPADVAGQATVRAVLALPLLRDLPIEDVAVSAEAALSDVGLPLGDTGLVLAAPALALVADTVRLRLEGEGVLGAAGRAGSALRLAWDEVFSPGPAEPRTRLTASLRLRPAEAQALGLPATLPGVRLGEAVPLDLVLTRGGGVPAGATAFTADVDLGGATLAAPALGWRKAPGGRAVLGLAGSVAAGGIALDRVAFNAAGLLLRARARLAAGGGLDRLDIEALRIDPGTDLAATVTRAGAGFEATVRGRSLDIRPLVAEARAAETAAPAAADDGPPGPAATVRLLIDRLVLDDDLAIGAVRAELRRGPDGDRSLSLDGVQPGGASLSLRLARDASGAGPLRLASGDAGALLRAAGVFGRSVGGALDIEAAWTADGVLAGEARVDDITVSDDRALDRLLAGAELQAALDRVAADGIRFSTLRAPFRLERGRLSLTEAVAYGPVLGLTLTGDYDLSADRLAMQGVFTPLFGLNALVGNVPLLGRILTGGEGQGLIAFTFRLTGPADDPSVSVNPLSALLPGILRQVVQPRAGSGGEQDSPGDGGDGSVGISGGDELR